MTTESTHVPTPTIKKVYYSEHLLQSFLSFKMSDESFIEEAIGYFDDEITFKDSELVGLTLCDALELKAHKDMDYLRS
jgi:hypothetical protein